MRPPPRHAERLRRPHQEATGEQRHQGQHTQIHPIGPAQRIGAARLGLRRCQHGIGGQRGLYRRARTGAFGQFQIKPVQAPHLAKAPLRLRNVDHRDLGVIARCRQPSHNPELRLTPGRREREGVARLQPGGTL